MRERPFTVSGGILSPNATISGGKNQLALRAESAATILEVSGTLPGATEIEGADLTVEARGPNLRRLFDFLGVAIPDTRKYRITSRLTKAEEEWRFTRLKGTFGRSEEHTSELQSLMRISYAVFCLKKKKKHIN